MSIEIKYGMHITDSEWGCKHFEVEHDSQAENVKLCFIEISNIQKIAVALTKQILDTSWMMNFDKPTRRSYERTVNETADLLIEVFSKASGANNIAGEFGESMVSMGSARALEILFDHYVLPVAELWKPQVKQNEGFDFHTVCPKEVINFGEAKFVSSGNSHGKAISQSAGFIDEEKHFRDRNHLLNLVSETAMTNFDTNDDFGVIASFSINSDNPLDILENALKSAQKTFPSRKVKFVYLIGVKH
jgi:hypothetical protein